MSGNLRDEYHELMRNVGMPLREEIEAAGPISADVFIAVRQRAYRALCAESGVVISDEPGGMMHQPA